jgi:hypothetical protein
VAQSPVADVQSDIEAGVELGTFLAAPIVAIGVGVVVDKPGCDATIPLTRIDITAAGELEERLRNGQIQTQGGQVQLGLGTRQLLGDIYTVCIQRRASDTRAASSPRLAS